MLANDCVDVIYFSDRSQEQNDQFGAFLEEIRAHMSYVLSVKFGWNVIDNPEISLGAGHVVIRFEKDGRRLVFRVPQRGLDQLKRSMLAYRHVEDLGFMPQKIYHDGKCIIEEHVDGIPLNPEVSDLLIIRLAQSLSKMHAVQTGGYGPLRFDLQGSHSDAASFHAGEGAIVIDRSEMDLTEHQSSKLELAVEYASKIPVDLADIKTRLGHGDLWRKNVLIERDQFKIIDWDRIGAYPVELDLAFMVDADFSTVQQELFMQHYEHAVRSDLLRWIALRRVLLSRKLQLRKKLQVIELHQLI